MWALRTSAPLVRPPARILLRSVPPLLLARAYSRSARRTDCRDGHSRTSLATTSENIPRQPKRFELRPHRTPHTRKAKAPSDYSRSSSRPSRSIQKDDNPWTTSVRLRRWIERHKTFLTPAQVDEVTRLVIEAPQHMLNAPVWNMLIGYMGRLRKLDRVWSLYNQMKKRNFTPTARTYSTILNAYAGVAHSGQTPDFSFKEPEKRTMSRVTIVYNHSQEYMKKLIEAQGAEEDLGVAISGVRLKEDRPQKPMESLQSDIDIAPTNAYLKFLSRHGLFSQMQRIFLSLPQSGPLAPDTVTYSLMFTALYHVHRSLEHHPNGKANAMMIGPTAKALWDHCLKQYSKEEGQGGQVDNGLVAMYVRCLLRGRPEDQRLAVSVIEQVWNLPSPGNSNPTSTSIYLPPPLLTTYPIPKLDIDVKSATALISSLHTANLPVLATHYTHLILSSSSLVPSFDLEFFKTAILALSVTGEVQSIVDIMDTYQPPSSGKEGWPRDTYRAALTAARWAGDYVSALSIFRRATHLSSNVGYISTDPSTPSKKIEPYRWVTPNGLANDKRGVFWVKPTKIDADAQLLGLLIKTAMQKSNKEIRSALDVYARTGGESKFLALPSAMQADNVSTGRKLLRDGQPNEIDSSTIRKQVASSVDLARDIQRAAERLGKGYEKMAAEAGEVVTKWAWVEREARKKTPYVKDDTKNLQMNIEGSAEDEELDWEDEPLVDQRESRVRGNNRDKRHPTENKRWERREMSKSRYDSSSHRQYGHEQGPRKVKPREREATMHEGKVSSFGLRR
ncbi:hypothetical protein J010_05911 [Cryptococcus neoformans]|nr:hypothetical protein C355_05854 [Cryptococcus neoformans var. grubii Th84]OXG92271.1 hypothetical protein C345_05796 [Cryptococcus neoformans var. grubii A2-102-5]OXH02915.1 hypothetical protein J010_05911 [Cryptococcus neoformans var. grubii]OXH24703.1 hypothetical protein J009_05901 [Cryptococcus neoformans var. grubii]OXH44748.1 hypothetical protein J004_05950 [Cryptococcus neoformans var. grubii]